MDLGDDKYMKCPFCGKEIMDGSTFCSFCGANLETSDQINNQIKESSNYSDHTENPTINNSGVATTQVTPQNFRDLPTYKRNILLMDIFSVVSMLLFFLSLLGSLLFRFTSGNEAFTIIMFAFGLAGGLGFFIAVITLNKKTLPQVNPGEGGFKLNFKEIVPGLCAGLVLAAGISALVVQGIYLIVY